MDKDCSLLQGGVINSFDDLFEMYHALISPVKEFENTLLYRDELSQRISNSNGTIMSSCVMPFVTAITLTVKFAIPFLIVFYIIVNVIHMGDGEKLFYVYDSWIGNTAFMLWMNGFINGGIIKMMFFTIICLIISWLILPCVIFLLPLMFTFGMIATIFSVISAKKTLSFCKEEVPKTDDKIREIEEKISFAISFVPPDYRYSEALEFFCKSYYNKKVSTLSEAINLYDTYLHQQRMEQNQQEIIAAQNQMLSSLAYQSAKINSLGKKVAHVKDEVTWKLL